MRRILAILCIFICFLFGGCNSWMDGDYLSVSPHEEQVLQDGTNVIEVSNYVQMRDALAELVDVGAERGIMTADAFNSGTMHFYIGSAIDEILNSNPVCAYAVKDITYEVGTNRGSPVVAFQIDYRHTRSEILRIRQVDSMSEATSVIKYALDNCDESIVLRVTKYNDVDYAQIVKDYAYENPDIVMEIPRIEVAAYPESGSDRVVSVKFIYQTDRDTLRFMQMQVEAVFTSAKLYVKETSKVMDIFSRLYSFLMDRNKYTVQTSITPAYSLLNQGMGNSRAFATVYAAMCRDAGLNCKVVSGTRDGEPWCWNMVGFRGEYYHVDLLRCSENGSFQMTKAEDLVGYVWDYDSLSNE